MESRRRWRKRPRRRPRATPFAFVAAPAAPDTKARFAQPRAEPVPSPPAQAAALIRREPLKRCGSVVQVCGAKAG